MEQLGIYVSHTYNYGGDVQTLVENLESTLLVKPEASTMMKVLVINLSRRNK